MKTQQRVWSEKTGWKMGAGTVVAPQMVLFFAAPSAISRDSATTQLSQFYPTAAIVGCTTGGEILGPDLYEDSIVATAIEFEHSQVQILSETVGEPSQSFECGARLATALQHEDLRAILLFCDGLCVNGAALASGINSVCQGKIPVIGGLAGDGARFGSTMAGVNGAYAARTVVAIGLYGKNLAISHGSNGGWDSFGPKRLVTRSEGNVLFELDGEPALDLYKRYLGEEATNLPGSALHFPLSLEVPSSDKGEVVRTILAVDEAQHSLSFAGDIPSGASVRLMRANLDRLVSAAGNAAQHAVGAQHSQFAILISCIGRKLVMGQRAVEEVEAVVEALGHNCAIMGFYSYGEICPLNGGGMAELHNQTMTVYSLSETA